MRRVGSHPLGLKSPGIPRVSGCQCDGWVRTANPDSRAVAREISRGAPPYPFRARKDPDFSGLAKTALGRREFCSPSRLGEIRFETRCSPGVDQSTNGRSSANRASRSPLSPTVAPPHAPSQQNARHRFPGGRSEHALRALASSTSCGGRCQGQQNVAGTRVWGTKLARHDPPGAAVLFNWPASARPGLRKEAAGSSPQDRRGSRRAG